MLTIPQPEYFQTTALAVFDTAGVLAYYIRFTPLPIKYSTDKDLAEFSTAGSLSLSPGRKCCAGIFQSVKIFIYLTADFFGRVGHASVSP